jgi:WxL domain surface cell wall-binding
MKQRILVSLFVGALALVAVSVAVAGTMTTTATVSGSGTVSVNVPSASALTDTLDGTDQTVTYQPALAVADARGTGGGWNLTVSSTTFSDGSGHTLAPGSVSAVAQACHSGSTCTQATSSGFTYPLTLSATAAKFFSAASQTGLGKVDVTPTISVAIPGNAYAGTYSSTVTIAAATGP